MSTSPVPVQPTPVQGVYSAEPNTFSDISSLYQYFQPLSMKMSKNSPPVVNLDVSEGQLIFDKSTLKLWTVINGTLRYVQFT